MTLGKFVYTTIIRLRELPRAIYADAYTVGQDIFFAEGMYRPEILPGRLLLAHELTHTVQQRTSLPAGADSLLGLSTARIRDAAQDPLESEARRISEHILLRGGMPLDNTSAISVTNMRGGKIISRQISRSSASAILEGSSDMQMVSSVVETIVHSLEEDPSDEAGNVRNQLAGLNQPSRQLVLDSLRNQLEGDHLEFVRKLLLSVSPEEGQQELMPREGEVGSRREKMSEEAEKKDSEEEETDKEEQEKGEEEKKKKLAEEKASVIQAPSPETVKRHSADLIKQAPKNGEEEIAKTPKLQKGAMAKEEEQQMEQRSTAKGQTGCASNCENHGIRSIFNRSAIRGFGSRDACCRHHASRAR